MSSENKIFIITEIVNGKEVKTRLPRMQAIRLHQKLLKEGAKVKLDKEIEDVQS